MVAPVTEVIGTSENGVNMVVSKFDVPDPIYRLYVQSRIHGDEDEGQDAANLFITDISANTSPPYYANISIHVLTNANPDGEALNQRLNINGLDLNRDWEIIASKEVLNIHKHIRSFRPHAIIDVHNFPPSQSWLTSQDVKFDHDMLMDYPTSPMCRRSLTSGQYSSLLSTIKAENPLYKYDRYVNPDTTGRTRFSTEDIVDTRNGTAFRYDTLSFIFEGREKRSDEADTVQKNRTRQAQFGALRSTAIWLRNNTSVFMGTLTTPAVRSSYPVRSHYTINTTYTMDMYHISTDTVAPFDFTNFDTGDENYKFTSFPLGYAIHEDNQAPLVSHLKNKLGYTYTSGKSSDRYDIETIHIDAADAWDDQDGVLEDQDMPANVDVTYKRSTRTGFSNYKLFFTSSDGGYQLPFYLEPLSKYGLARHRDLMKLPIKKGTNYAILRLMRRR